MRQEHNGVYLHLVMEVQMGLDENINAGSSRGQPTNTFLEINYLYSTDSLKSV